MSQKGDDLNLEERFIWQIPGFSKLTERVTSEPFTLDLHRWRILLFPRGLDRVRAHNVLSAFLEMVDLPDEVGWHRDATFAITILNWLDPDKHSRKEDKNTYRVEEKDWGFESVISLLELTEEKGYLQNDTISIQVEVRVTHHYVVPPGSIHPVHSYAALYDSKKETGYVGLKNQGATCYLNSLLQALFHITYFRSAVYGMPTEKDGEKSIPLALQRIFYYLQYGNKSVGTKKLTKAFGWDDRDAFTQHDVQELNRVLCDNLETKMKSTPAEGTIEKLFQGKTTMYIDCVHIDYKSNKTESYLDLQLNVKNCKNIYESLDQYVEVETLEGQNKYFAEGHGLQDAKKGCRFESFPPVLMLQLKRFEFDLARCMNIKINDEYRFFLELDVAKYLTNSDGVCTKYQLHGVLVHEGDVGGGHYYAFIRPTMRNQWYKFDDSRVMKVLSHNAIQDNYGGEEVIIYQGHRVQRPKKLNNAYMLVYVRESERADIMTSECNVPAYLEERFQEEQNEKKRLKERKAEEGQYQKIKVVTEQDLHEHRPEKFDLVDFESIQPIKVKKVGTVGEFKRQIAEHFKLSLSEFRLWSFARRRNKTIRPDSDLFLPPRETDQFSPKLDLQIYLEKTEGKDATSRAENEILLFFKLHKPQGQNLEYLGSRFVKNTVKIQELDSIILELKKGLKGPFVFYEEVSSIRVDTVVVTKTLKEAKLGFGDILVVQELSEPNQQPTVKEFYEGISNRVTIAMKKFENLNETFTVQINKKQKYEELLRLVSDKIGANPDFVRFYGHQRHPQFETIKKIPAPRTLEKPVGDLLEEQSSAPYVLHYEVLPIPVTEAENKKKIKIFWQDEQGNIATWKYCYVAKEGITIDRLIEEFKKAMEFPPEKQVRLLECFGGRIENQFVGNQDISALNIIYELRAEEILPDELNKKEGDIVVPVYHFSRDYSPLFVSFHSNPFMFHIKEGETVADVKAKLKKRLHVSDPEFEKWKVFKLKKGTLNPTPEIVQDTEVASSVFDGVILGLEHPNKSRFRHTEKPIVIHN